MDSTPPESGRQHSSSPRRPETSRSAEKKSQRMLFSTPPSTAARMEGAANPHLLPSPPSSHQRPSQRGFSSPRSVQGSTAAELPKPTSAAPPSTSSPRPASARFAVLPLTLSSSSPRHITTQKDICESVKKAVLEVEKRKRMGQFYYCPEFKVNPRPVIYPPTMTSWSRDGVATALGSSAAPAGGGSVSPASTRPHTAQTTKLIASTAGAPRAAEDVSSSPIAAATTTPLASKLSPEQEKLAQLERGFCLLPFHPTINDDHLRAAKEVRRFEEAYIVPLPIEKQLRVPEEQVSNYFFREQWSLEINRMRRAPGDERPPAPPSYHRFFRRELPAFEHQDKVYMDELRRKVTEAAAKFSHSSVLSNDEAANPSQSKPADDENSD